MEEFAKWKGDAIDFLQSIVAEVKEEYGGFIVEEYYEISTLSGRLKLMFLVKNEAEEDREKQLSLILFLNHKGFINYKFFAYSDPRAKRSIYMYFYFTVPFTHPRFIQDEKSYFLKHYEKRRNRIEILGGD